MSSMVFGARQPAPRRAAWYWESKRRAFTACALVPGAHAKAPPRRRAHAARREGAPGRGRHRRRSCARCSTRRSASAVERPPARLRLTHPARWGQRRLEKLRQAARSAGIEDPTFAPRARGGSSPFRQPTVVHRRARRRLRSRRRHIDTAVLERTDEAFAVVGIPGGDEELGGEDFDDLLYRHLGEQLDGDTWYQLRHSAGPGGERAWPQANRELLRHARRAKEGLSRKSEYEFYLPQPIDHEFHATASDLERLIGPILRGTAAELERTILAAGRKPSELEAIYLAGGSSRIPLVGRILQQRLGVLPHQLDDPQVVIALGAVQIGSARHLSAANRPAPHAVTRRAEQTLDDTVVPASPKETLADPSLADPPRTPRRRPTDRSRPQPTPPSPVASGSTHRTSSEPPATPPTTRHVADSPPSATALSPPTPSWPSRASRTVTDHKFASFFALLLLVGGIVAAVTLLLPKSSLSAGKFEAAFPGKLFDTASCTPDEPSGPHIAEQVVCMPVSNATGQDIGEFHFYLYKALTDRRAAFRLAETVADRRSVEPIQTGQDCNHNFSDGYWYDTGRSRHTVGGQALCYTDKTRASHLFVTFKGSRVLMDGLRPDENHGALWDWFITNISHDFSPPR